MRAAAANLVCISLMIISLWFMDLSYAGIDLKTCLGMWLFDEGKGEEAKDSSEKGNNGKLMKGPKWVEGKFGKALEFDGVGAHVPIGSFSGYSDKVTLVAWIKSSGSSAWDDIVCGPCGDIIFAVEDNKLNFAGQCANPIPHNTWSTTLLNDNKWHHAGGTYDGKKVSVVVDGKLEASNPAGGSFTIGPKSIGSNHEGNGEHYKGLIDEVAIFNVALAEDDIKTIMNNGLSRALGMTAVSSSGKLAQTWGSIKEQ